MKLTIELDREVDGRWIAEVPELNVLLYGEQITKELRFAQTRYISESERVDRDAWARRPAVQRYLDSAAALLSPLL